MTKKLVLNGQSDKELIFNPGMKRSELELKKKKNMEQSELFTEHVIGRPNFLKAVEKFQTENYKGFIVEILRWCFDKLCILLSFFGISNLLVSTINSPLQNKNVEVEESENDEDQKVYESANKSVHEDENIAENEITHDAAEINYENGLENEGIIISKKNNTSGYVYCQFCYARLESRQCLIDHLESNCNKFIDKSYQNLKKHPKFLFQAHFQLLLNNKIACIVCDIVKFDDLIKKQIHEQSIYHKRSLREKNLEVGMLNNFVCCNFCKILIPDTDIHLKSHLENEEHKTIVSNIKFFDAMAEKEYHYIILKNNKVKCLVCFKTGIQCDKEKIRSHNNDSWHKKNETYGKFTDSEKAFIFCEHCHVIFELEEWDDHMSTEAQIANYQKRKSTFHSAMKFEYCLFCEEAFPDLDKLALHLEEQKLHRDEIY